MDARDFGWNSALNGHLAVLGAFALNAGQWFVHGLAWAVLGLLLCALAWGSAWVSSGLTWLRMEGAEVPERAPEVLDWASVAFTVAAWACFILPALA